MEAQEEYGAGAVLVSNLSSSAVGVFAQRHPLSQEERNACCDGGGTGQGEQGVEQHQEEDGLADVEVSDEKKDNGLLNDHHVFSVSIMFFSVYAASSSDMFLFLAKEILLRGRVIPASPKTRLLFFSLSFSLGNKKVSIVVFPSRPPDETKLARLA